MLVHCEPGAPDQLPTHPDVLRQYIRVAVHPGAPRTTAFVNLQVNLHLDGGMAALYKVSPNSASPSDPVPKPNMPAGGTVREYYIAVDEVEW